MKQPLELPPDLLPESARLLIELIGDAATLTLIRQFGGVRYPVPVKTHNEHALAKLIGLDAAVKLTAHFGGEKIQVPKCDQLIRYQQVKQLLDQGLSVRQVALNTAYCERTIYRIKDFLNGENTQQTRWDF